VNCENCGACCELLIFHASGNIDAAWLAARSGRLSGQAVLFPQVCKFYDVETKKCKIYENRPDSCRLFKVGGLDCLLCRRTTQK
jgi:Fe-S-cluster containining protein